MILEGRRVCVTEGSETLFAMMTKKEIKKLEESEQSKASLRRFRAAADESIKGEEAVRAEKLLVT